MKEFKVFVLFTTFVASCLSALDETLLEKTSGSGVVEAVINKIESSSIFDNDNLFLRRIAFVESTDGTDPKTFRAGYYGGIWQVDQQMFIETQSSSLLNDKKQNISNYFKFNWNSVQWSDLLKPLYSGLAARIFNQLKTRSNSKISSVSDQANFWKRNYRLTGSEIAFVNKLSSLQHSCARGAADVIFIVDESGSIGIDNYKKVKEFLKKVVNALNVGPDPVKDSRLSLVTFATDVVVAFNFRNFTTKASYTSAVHNMGYSAKDTRTHLALQYLREKAFNLNLGTRSGVPKIAIVLTDGQSNNVSATLVEARKLQKTDITVLAVGVGSKVNIQELDEIATDPDCRHRFLLDDFQAFDSFLNIIERKTCDAPVTLINETVINIPPSGSQQCKLSITSNGITIEVYNSGGNSAIYFSSTTSPSSSFYDYKFYFGSSPIPLYLPYSPKVSGSSTYAYCLIQGDPLKPASITLTPCPGDCNPCNKISCPKGTICKYGNRFTQKCENPPSSAYRKAPSLLIFLIPIYIAIK